MQGEAVDRHLDQISSRSAFATMTEVPAAAAVADAMAPPRIFLGRSYILAPSPAATKALRSRDPAALQVIFGIRD